MCDECEGRWALVRTLGGLTLKNPAEKQEPRKEGKHWGGERGERRIPETKACVSRRKEGATQLETKVERSRSDKDTEYSPLTCWGSRAKWRSWVFREGAEGKLLLAKE